MPSPVVLFGLQPQLDKSSLFLVYRGRLVESSVSLVNSLLFFKMRVSVLVLSFVSATAVNAQYANPPYYPAPKGGWLPEWSASYEKARALVSRMTLAGKVNITTATGWQMVRIHLQNRVCSG